MKEHEMTGDKKRPLTPAELSQGFDPLASYKFPKLPEIKSPAEYVVEAFASSIRHFEASLNSDQEIGFRLVSLENQKFFISKDCGFLVVNFSNFEEFQITSEPSD